MAIQEGAELDFDLVQTLFKTFDNISKQLEMDLKSNAQVSNSKRNEE